MTKDKVSMILDDEELAEVEAAIKLTVDTIITTMKMLLERKEFVLLSAKFSRRHYNALIDAGFDPEEAIQIVANMKMK